MFYIININQFLQNPLIKKLADYPNWAISSPNKVPMDMYNLKNGIVSGCSPEIPYSMMTLHEINEHIQNVPNLAFYLNNDIHDVVCLDVEKTTSGPLKRKFLSTDYIYGERSLSGKGYHLWYNTPDNFYDFNNASQKIVLREEEGNYELLLNHWVTFTGNTIKLNTQSSTDITIETIYESLAKQLEEKQIFKQNYTLEEINISNIPYATEILSYLDKRLFNKTPQDYPDKNNITGYDMSRYEFSYMCSRYSNIKWFIENKLPNNITLSLNDICTLMYKTAQDTLEYRDKHATLRNNQPWLFYTATQAINFCEGDVTK